MNHTIIDKGGLQAMDANAETDIKEIYDPKTFLKLVLCR